MFDRSVRHLLAVAGVALMLSLAVPGVAAAVEYTRGFEVRNDSSVKLTFTGITQFQPVGELGPGKPGGFPWGIAGPSIGTSILPGDRQRFEVTYQFLNENNGTLRYEIGDTGRHFLVGLLVAPLGSRASVCDVPRGFRCTADKETYSENIVTFGK